MTSFLLSLRDLRSKSWQSNSPSLAERDTGVDFHHWIRISRIFVAKRSETEVSLVIYFPPSLREFTQ